MKNCAIICEYNPLHTGHLYQIDKTRTVLGCDNIIAIMSGSFTQRGIPAIYDKWKRTEAALENGVDMVIELPAVYAVSTAERFALGGILTANAAGIIDSLNFGSETDNINLLKQTAELLLYEPQAFRNDMKKYLSQGMNHASARSKAAENQIPGAAEVLNGSNAVLAVEYIKALIKTESSISPTAIKRSGQGERDFTVSSAMPSALAIREELKCGKKPEELLPESIAKLFKTVSPVFHEDIFGILKYRLLNIKAEEMEIYSDISEGLENKIIAEIKNAHSMSELITSVKSKRYTYARISRILTNILIGITEDISKKACENVPYIRVLGIRKEASALLSELNKYASVPVITNAKAIKNELLDIDIKASDIRSIFDKTSMGRDYTEKMIII